MRNLSSRLLLGVVTPLLGLWLLVALVQYGRGRSHAQEAFDRTLLTSAQVIADALVVTDGAVVSDIPEAALAMLSPHGDSGVLYRVTCADPPFPLAGHLYLPAPAPSPTGLPALVDFVHDGARLRMATLRRPIVGAADCAAVDIQLAETMEKRDGFSNRLWRDDLVTHLTLIAAAGLLTFVGVRHALKPLHQLARDVNGRHPEDVSEIGVSGVPGEVVPLMDAINVHSRRQIEAYRANTDFVANVSHQLKTSLAVLRPLADLALRQQTLADTRALVSELREGTRVLERVLHQSLALLRAESKGSIERVDFDFVEVARNAAFELLPLALDKDIDLEFTDHGAQRVSGSPFLLHEMVTNIVDNAIRYSPLKGKIIVSVDRHERWVTLSVRDHGPGIAAEEIDKVFQRYYRPAGSKGDGCGLGLPIVRQICEQHGGDVRLQVVRGKPGLRVIVRLPANG